jgi:hypothetical protein
LSFHTNALLLMSVHYGNKIAVSRGLKFLGSLKQMSKVVNLLSVVDPVVQVASAIGVYTDSFDNSVGQV